MLLCMSSGHGRPLEDAKEMTGEIALEAADRLPLALSLAHAPRDVNSGGRVVPSTREHDLLERAVAVILVAPVLAFGATTAGAALPPRLSEGQAKRIFLADAKVASWLRHYPRSTWVTTVALHSSDRRWQVHVFSGAAAEVATGLVA